MRPEDDLDHRAIAAAAIAVGPLAVTATLGGALGCMGRRHRRPTARVLLFPAFR